MYKEKDDSTIISIAYMYILFLLNGQAKNVGHMHMPCIYMYTHIHVLLHSECNRSKYITLSAHYIYKHTYMHTYMHIHIFVCTYIHTYVHVYNKVQPVAMVQPFKELCNEMRDVGM